MARNSAERWMELIALREKLEGTKIIRMVLHLASSQYTVNRNYQELSKALNWYEKNLSIWNVRNRLKLDAFLREILRLLQNYLSTIYSLIQQSKLITLAVYNQ